MVNRITNRKNEHIDISITRDIQSKTKTGFSDVFFIHKALPEIDKPKINLSTKFLNHKFNAPIIVGAITGGTSKASKINSIIAEVVEELGLGMGLGSQRIAIENEKLVKSFLIARKKAENAFLIANIGGIQLVNGYGLKEVKKAVKMIDADAIAIHLNALQEAVQPEGQTNFKGVLNKISDIIRELDKPVIIKETGAGISAEIAKKIEEVGAKAIDVSGLGGTSFSAVEYYRAKITGDVHKYNLGNVFWDWGIPTSISTVEVSKSVNIPAIASGGIRNGEDIAKALALGASMTSLSQPVLCSAIKDVTETNFLLSNLIEELKTCMFLVGADSIEKLQRTPVIILGKTAEWLKLRGFNIGQFINRQKK